MKKFYVFDLLSHEEIPPAIPQFRETFCTIFHVFEYFNKPTSKKQRKEKMNSIDFEG